MILFEFWWRSGGCRDSWRDVGGVFGFAFDFVGGDCPLELSVARLTVVVETVVAFVRLGIYTRIVKCGERYPVVNVFQTTIERRRLLMFEAEVEVEGAALSINKV